VAQLVPLVLENFEAVPTFSYKDLRANIKPYLQPHAKLSNSQCQSITQKARLVVFGDEHDNLKYLPALVQWLVRQGHQAQYTTVDRKGMLQALVASARAEFKGMIAHMPQHKRPQIGIKGAAKKFWLEWERSWLRTNEVELRNRIGNNADSKFIYSVSWAPKESIDIFDKLLLIGNADAAHMTNGLTLMSVYGFNSIHGMVLLSHTIVAGNESFETWKLALTFSKKTYPALDSRAFTMLMDQDKGGEKAWAAVFEHALQFCCYMHRQKNVQVLHKREAHKAFEAAVLARTVKELDEGLVQITEESPRFYT
jgi:hypothetical protein